MTLVLKKEFQATYQELELMMCLVEGYHNKGQVTKNVDGLLIVQVICLFLNPLENLIGIERHISLLLSFLKDW